jgi:cytochrome c oxidase subunit 4
MPRPENDTPIPSTRTLVLTWASLLALTALTVAVARGQLLAGYGVLAALAIASAKAGLVLAVFMQLKDESRLLQGLALFAVLTLLTMLAGTFADVWYR